MLQTAAPPLRCVAATALRNTPTASIARLKRAVFEAQQIHRLSVHSSSGSRMVPPPDACATGDALRAAADAGAHAATTPARRRLVAFDFDHSIADANSDTFIIPADAPLPRALKNSYQTGRWTEYMQRVLTHLHTTSGLGAPGLQATMSRLPLVDGMGALLTALAEHKDTVDCIIISDSNSLFIEWALSAWGHGATFAQVFTNTAKVETATGRLLLAPHDTGHGCGRCPVNMCKRITLGRYLLEKAAQGIEYDRIAYVGDGGNDLCPSAALLGPSDVVFARKGFALDKALTELDNPQLGPAAAAAAAASGPDASAGGSFDNPLADFEDFYGRTLQRTITAAAAEAVGPPPLPPPRATVVRWDGGSDIQGWLEAQGWWGCGDDGGDAHAAGSASTAGGR